MISLDPVARTTDDGAHGVSTGAPAKIFYTKKVSLAHITALQA